MQENYSLWREFLSPLKPEVSPSVKQEVPDTDEHICVPDAVVGENCLSREFAVQLTQERPVSGVRRRRSPSPAYKGTIARQRLNFADSCPGTGSGDEDGDGDGDGDGDRQRDGQHLYIDAKDKCGNDLLQTMEASCLGGYSKGIKRKTNCDADEGDNEMEDNIRSDQPFVAKSDQSHPSHVPYDTSSSLTSTLISSSSLTSAPTSTSTSISTSTSSPSAGFIPTSQSTYSKTTTTPNRSALVPLSFSPSGSSPVHEDTSSVQSYRNISASKWNLEMFSSFFDFKQKVSQLRVHPDTQDNNIPTAVSDLYRDVKQMVLCRDTDLKKETNIRILLDGLLLRMCKSHDLHLQTEEEFKLMYLPSCRFDYLLLKTDGTPVGCVEAKRPASFDEKAFVQAVLEVCVVQQLACHRKVNVEKTPVFCILSDGYRFVLMQLKGRQLYLEHNWSTPEDGLWQSRGGHLKIRVLKNDEDFSSLVRVISRLITMTDSR